MSEKKFSEIYTELYNIELPIQEIKLGKDNLVYLSWNCAFDIMSRKFDDFEMIPTKFENGKNYSKDEDAGYYVETTIKAGGFSRTLSLPVMGDRNDGMTTKEQTITTKFGDYKVPPATTRDINDAIMRCAVKTIALFGLGMKLYIREEAEKIKKELEKNGFGKANTYSGWTGNEMDEIKEQPQNKTKAKYAKTKQDVLDMLKNYNLDDVKKETIANYIEAKGFKNSKGWGVNDKTLEFLGKCRWDLSKF